MQHTDSQSQEVRALKWGWAFDELITDMLCLCKDSEASALAGELECCIRRPICVPRSFCPDLERSM
jgi:hypothetical protein